MVLNFFTSDKLDLLNFFETVLTAAHCCEGMDKVEIIVGEHNLYDFFYIKDPSVEERFEVNSDNWHMHPKYDTETLDYDVCVIKQESGGLLRLGRHACLPQLGKGAR